MIIDKFPDNRPWRIDFLGSITRNEEGNRDQLLVAVHLTCLKDNFEKAYSKESIAKKIVDTKEHEKPRPIQETIHVGLGFLTFLKVGSVWINKELSAPRYINSQQIKINPTNYKKLSIADTITIDNIQYHALSKSHYDLNTHYDELEQETLFFFKNTMGHKAQYNLIIIPQIEIFRFYYFSSSNMLDFLMFNTIEDTFNKNLTYANELNDVHIKFKKEFRNEDAWFVARYLTSTTMKQQIVKFKNYLRLNSTQEKIAISINPPHLSEGKLDVIGKPIKLSQVSGSQNSEIDEKWAFFVTEIKQCYAPMKFNEVYAERDNDGRQAENRDEATERSYKCNAISTQPGQSSDIITSNDEVSSEYKKKQLNDYVSRFAYLKNKRLHRYDKPMQQYKSSQSPMWQQEADQYNATNPTTGLGNVGEVHIQTMEEGEDKVESKLLDFIETINGLCLLNNIKVTYLELNKIQHTLFHDFEKPLSYFPSYIPGVRSWHRIRRRTRSIVIAELCLHGHFFYLLELERKNQEAFATLLVYQQSYNQIHKHSFEELLITTAKRNRWPTRVEAFDLRHQTIRHPHKKFFGEKYKEEFINSIKRNIEKHICKVDSIL